MPLFLAVIETWTTEGRKPKGKTAEILTITTKMRIQVKVHCNDIPSPLRFRQN